MTRDEIEEIKRHFGVVAEGLERKIQLVAEGVATLNDKLDHHMEENRAQFEEVKAMIRFSYAELDRRLRTLEETVISLQTRVERLEALR